MDTEYKCLSTNLSQTKVTLAEIDSSFGLRSVPTAAYGERSDRPTAKQSGVAEEFEREEIRSLSGTQAKTKRSSRSQAPPMARRQDPTKSLGHVLQKRRHALGMTQREVASRLGVKPAHVAYLETDRRRPSLGLLAKIASLLELDKERLFNLAHPEARGLLGLRREPKSAGNQGQVWENFRQNRPLLARHQIKPGELKLLKQVNLLGKVSAPRNFLFILNAIRQAVEEEE
jgi:transcriptional regulator with XRE-family HTH domain